MGGFGEVQTVRLFYGMRVTGGLQAREAELRSTEPGAATAAGS
ncbi:hypothetical protein R70211_02054 [Paraburkholderia domus]|jgi:hypothetical protein|uniref:Uncharacterized protein n=1 Tax=Paraburkholderia domus TaxID=2793075 RepID=A0A9N8MNQ7_9BURK|nr:hypothetical protein R75483_04240 [Paraburkholderia domus]CAE6880064.1 hypothetical protein R70211_02054 [Paraburkholderia domus]CAE6885975.1 hypothetical protein R75471_02082 [Paraburkholderia domus]